MFNNRCRCPIILQSCGGIKQDHKVLFNNHSPFSIRGADQTHQKLDIMHQFPCRGRQRLKVRVLRRSSQHPSCGDSSTEETGAAAPQNLNPTTVIVAVHVQETVVPDNVQGATAVAGKIPCTICPPHGAAAGAAAETALPDRLATAEGIVNLDHELVYHQPEVAVSTPTKGASGGSGSAHATGGFGGDGHGGQQPFVTAGASNARWLVPQGMTVAIGAVSFLRFLL
ncbi:hypothetical protein B0H63DRAFT_516021 [Podospora didyma]|uniref:Uncharacterized protein n=1 Tax=Podospora didyma TaxID=330526 RepID=A0AAE0P3S8_9PEZI|nr:hypothetical protein B0H63DRAFT_516021 [Podospora didyma]